MYKAPKPDMPGMIESQSGPYWRVRFGQEMNDIVYLRDCDFVGVTPAIGVEVILRVFNPTTGVMIWRAHAK